MRKLVLLLSLLSVTASYAQEIKDGTLNPYSRRYYTLNKGERPEGWTIKGNNNLMFNQAAFSNWIAGGVNSLALTARMDYEFNLKRGKNIWDNRLITAYGIRSEKNDGSKKMEDVIDFTTKYGHLIKNNWYNAIGINFKTQFTKGYDYNVPERNYISNFMAPGYLTLGFGFDYIPSDTFQVNIHPISSRMTFITDQMVFRPFPDSVLTEAYGAKPGQSFVYQFGAYVGGRYRLRVMNNVTFDNNVGIFANYLVKPLNLVLAYSALLDLKVNRLISTQVSYNVFYDENQLRKIQMKETLGVGLTYKFGDKPKPPPKK